MSLLTSNTVNKDQRNFLTKMERYYHKRAGSNFIPKDKPQIQPQITTKIQSAAVYKIQDMISNFMKQVSQVVREFENVDHYSVLQILRKHEFFSDVASILDMDASIRLQELEKQCEKQEIQIRELRKEFKLSGDPRGQQKKKQENSYNSNKSLASNLYYHARCSTQSQFISFYNKISLSNPIEIQKVYQRPQLKSPTRFEQQSILAGLTELVSYPQSVNNEIMLRELIEKVQSLFNKKTKQCRRPCCLDDGNDDIVRLNKAKTLMNTTFSKGRQTFYKNDKSEEYFTRYYRGSSFNVHDITSVTRTKREQMEKLEDLYRKNLKIRHKNVGNHRYSASYALN